MYVVLVKVVKAGKEVDDTLFVRSMSWFAELRQIYSLNLPVLLPIFPRAVHLVNNDSNGNVVPRYVRA